MDESIAKRHERLRGLQRSNIDSWSGRQPKLDPKALDSNIKKNTGFIKKCKTSMGQDSAAQLQREVKLLKLEKYVSEIVPAAAEGLLRCKASADVAAAVDTMSALHARFPTQITVPLVCQLLKTLAPPAAAALAAMTPETRDREEQARLSKQKTVLRVVTEMYLSGLLWGIDALPNGVDGVDHAAAFMLSHASQSTGGSAGSGSSSSAASNKLAAKVREMVQQPGHCVLLGALQNLLLSDREHHLSILLAISFARSFKTDFALLGDEHWDASACAVSLDGDSTSEAAAPVVGKDTCGRLRVLLNEYLDSAIAHLTAMNKTLVRMRRNTEEKLFSKGVVYAEVKEKLEKHTKSFDKLLESVSMLCEPLGRTPPDFSESNDAENQMDIVFDAPSAAGAALASQSGLWEDKEERLFYEAIPSFESRLPPSMLTSSVRKKAKGGDAQSKAAAAVDSASAAAESSADKDSKLPAGSAEIRDEPVFEEINETTIGVDVPESSADLDDFGDDDAPESASALGLLEYQKFISQRRTADGLDSDSPSDHAAVSEHAAASSAASAGKAASATSNDPGSDSSRTQPPGLADERAGSKAGSHDSEREAKLTVVQQSGAADGNSQTIASRSLAEILRRLPTFTNKEDVDQTALDFCFVNNRANRAALIRALVDVPRRQLFLVPYYARMIAVLNPYFPEIGDGVLDELQHEFRWLVRQRFKDLMDTRLKNIKYIAELTKFKVAPLHVAYRCAKVLTEQLHAQNIEVLCSLLEGCGRFLLAQSATADRVSALLDILMRKRRVLNLDDRTILLIENACSVCRPQLARNVQHVKLRTPYELFIRKLLYEDLCRDAADRVCQKLRKLPWSGLAAGDDPQRVRHALVSCFTKPWKIKYSNVYLVTMIAGVLGRLHPWFRVTVVDAVMENIKVGLERNMFAYNQRRMAEMRYVGEMFIFKLVDSRDIIDLLYLILRHGHSVAHPVPGRACDIDPANDYFRVRMVATLLQTCGPYIRDPSDRRALNMFAVYFQMYILAKEQPLPIDTEYSVDSLYETVFTAVKRYEGWQEAAQAMGELVQRKTPAAVAANAPPTAAADAAGLRPPAGKGEQSNGAGQHNGPERGFSLEADDGEIGLVDEVLERSSDIEASSDDIGDADDNDDGVADGVAGGDAGEGGENEEEEAADAEEEELLLQQRKEIEEAEMAEARLQLEAMEALLEQEEEEMLEQEFNRLVVESSDPRKVERTSKLDVGIPMNLLGRSSAAQMTSSSAGAVAGPAESTSGSSVERAGGAGTGESDAIKFSLLTGKRQRPVVRDVNIPIESQIARNLRQQEESAMRQREHLKRIVLDYERREAAEEMRYYERESAAARPRAMGSAASRANASRFGNVYRRPVIPGATFIDKPLSGTSRRRNNTLFGGAGGGSGGGDGLGSGLR
ncbi:mRNA decay protein [Coemansia sp. RSA 2599]|nr:mRNA decay protein [Coemansia sp. RSA 2599]